MANEVSKMSLRLSIEGLATMVWVPEDQEDEAHPLGMLETRWENLSNKWWAPLKTMVLEPTYNPNPTPYKSENQHKKNKKGIIRGWIVPLDVQNQGQIEGFWEKLGL